MRSSLGPELRARIALLVEDTTLGEGGTEETAAAIETWCAEHPMVLDRWRTTEDIAR